jgi:hypothetical protein
MRPFDQVTLGTVEEYKKTGWSNYNGVQLELRRRYSKGYGYQLFYVVGNAFLAGGNGWSSDFVNTPSNYLPGAVPTGYDALNRFLNYKRDSTIPQHRVHWNWIVDLPFGRGRKLAGNAGGFVDRLIGGWQVAGFGTIRSNVFALPTSYWGPTSKVEIYGKKYPIEDCRSGVCYSGYLWYNGYIPANRINSYDANGKPNGVMGVPAEYKPAVTPVIPWGQTTLPANAPANTNLAAFWDTNTVWVPLKDGIIQRTTYDNGLNPYRNQFVPGVRSWSLDGSLFKTIRITERVFVRFNADFFNVLNMPGLSQPNSNTGIVSTQYSSNDPRQLQLTLRLTW